MFTNIPRKDMLMLDNFIYSFALDIENGVPIKPYYKGKDDYELEYLMEKLMLIANEPESTTLVDHVNRVLKLDEFYKYLGAKEDDYQDEDNIRQIARASVIIGAGVDKSPLPKSTYISPQRSTYVPNPSIQDSQVRSSLLTPSFPTHSRLPSSVPRVYPGYQANNNIQGSYLQSDVSSGLRNVRESSTNYTSSSNLGYGAVGSMSGFPGTGVGSTGGYGVIQPGHSRGNTLNYPVNSRSTILGSSPLQNKYQAQYSPARYSLYNDQTNNGGYKFHQ